MKRRCFFLAIGLLSSSAWAVQIGYNTAKGVESAASTSPSDWLSLSFDRQYKSRKLEGLLDANFRLYTGNSDTLYSIPEAYIQFNSLKSKNALGRKLMDWNRADKTWELGHHNGQQGFNLVGDQQEGLMGLHGERSVTRRLKVNYFASILHIPSLNPGYKFKNGEISSPIAWTMMPPKKMLLEGKQVPIHYEIGDYNAGEIAFQQSLGSRVAYDWKSGGMQAYGIYKPENKLRVNAEGKLNKNLDRVDVVATPQVNHHLVYGVGADQKLTRRLKMAAGFEVIDPNAHLSTDLGIVDPTIIKNNKRNFDAEYFKVQPNYQKQSYAHFATNYDAAYCRLGLNYLYNFAKQPGDEVFGDSVKWHNAVGASVDYNFNDNLSMLMDYKYDIKMGDNVIKNELSYRFLNQMSIAVGLELIKAPREDSYWSVYRENDTVYSNFGYSF